jgi:hypothetical protein
MSVKLGLPSQTNRDVTHLADPTFTPDPNVQPDRTDIWSNEYPINRYGNKLGIWFETLHHDNIGAGLNILWMQTTGGFGSGPLPTILGGPIGRFLNTIATPGQSTIPNKYAITESVGVGVEGVATLQEGLPLVIDVVPGATTFRLGIPAQFTSGSPSVYPYIPDTVTVLVAQGSG